MNLEGSYLLVRKHSGRAFGISKRSASPESLTRLCSYLLTDIRHIGEVFFVDFIR